MSRLNQKTRQIHALFGPLTNPTKHDMFYKKQ